MKDVLFALCLCLGLFAQQVAGADKHDLTGTWDLDESASELPPNSSFRKGLAWEIKQDGASVTIATVNSDGESTAQSASDRPMVFKMDGKPATVVLGIPQVASAGWEGDHAVIRWNQAAPAATTAEPSKAPVRRRSLAPFTWTLTQSPDKKTLTLEIHLIAPNAESGEKVVFRRRA